MNIKSANLAASRSGRQDSALEQISKDEAATVSLGTASPAPSSVSLSGLDGVNFFLAGILAGFGPYVAAYLADQRWTQENIGFVLTASGLAGLLSQLPGGELLDTVRSKRALVVAGAAMVAISAIIIAFQPSFPLVFRALMLNHGRVPGAGDRCD